MSLLELTGIRKHYGPVAALDGIDLRVEAGSRLAIVGPSGSGKSTLLRIIAGYEAPDAGRLSLDGAILAEDGTAVPAHRRGIGIVAQDGALFPHLTIAENIGFGLDRSAPGRDRQIAELMELVELDRAMLTRRPDQLSGGQQQRVALARALARKPRLMLLDEPFSALDTGLRAATRKAVAAVLTAADITTILVTHDQEEALGFADQVAVMRRGRLPQIGTPRELYLQPRDPMIAAFLGEAILLDARVENGRAVCALGAIAVREANVSGPCRIMLRPEQISLSPVLAGDPVPAGFAHGEVVETSFGGAMGTMVLRLSHAPSTETVRIVLRTAMAAAPAAGTMVRIAVSGSAHVFASAAEPA
jgi:iron(III) transport system ATP-binding protein